jgi:hypothetical protein
MIKLLGRKKEEVNKSEQSKDTGKRELFSLNNSSTAKTPQESNLT